jgi:hypothetical protein
MNDGTTSYTCFVCLLGSTDPKICTNCGAKIEAIDVENIVVTPPRWGEYLIHKEFFSPELVTQAVNDVTSTWYQNFQVLTKSPYKVIRSNERAYVKLMESLAKSKKIPIDDIKVSIPFTPIA